MASEPAQQPVLVSLHANIVGACSMPILMINIIVGVLTGHLKYSTRLWEGVENVLVIIKWKSNLNIRHICL